MPRKDFTCFDSILSFSREHIHSHTTNMNGGTHIFTDKQRNISEMKRWKKQPKIKMNRKIKYHAHAHSTINVTRPYVNIYVCV